MHAIAERKEKKHLEKNHEDVWASCFIFMPSDLPTHLAFWYRLVLYTGRIQALLFELMGPPPSQGAAQVGL